MTARSCVIVGAMQQGSALRPPDLPITGTSDGNDAGECACASGRCPFSPSGDVFR